MEEKVYIWIFNPEVEKEIRGSRYVRLLPKLKPDRPTTKRLVIRVRPFSKTVAIAGRPFLFVSCLQSERQEELHAHQPFDMPHLNSDAEASYVENMTIYIN